MSGDVVEPKSRTIELRVDGEILAEFIVDRLSVDITRHEVVVRGICRDTYEDKVLLNSASLETFGYAPDGSDIPEPECPKRCEHCGGGCVLALNHGDGFTSTIEGDEAAHLCRACNCVWSPVFHCHDGRFEEAS